MTTIYALTDYKNNFGSKWNADPYRSGYNKDTIEKLFHACGYEVVFLTFKDVDFSKEWKNRIIIYTSSEEHKLRYKNFIEDIILGLQLRGAHIIPSFHFIKANNNKVYMEILRTNLLSKEKDRYSYIYGTLEELLIDISDNRISFPCVVKKAEGTMSRGVYRAYNERELIRNVKKLNDKVGLIFHLKEKYRSIRHQGYQKQSFYQTKFIIQKYIPNLLNDWKIIIYGNHYYVLQRGIKHGDFRASGSHYDYRPGSTSDISTNILEEVRKIFLKLDVPNLSVDFAFDGNKCYLHEFQAIHFGTSTLDLSSDLFCFDDNQWKIEKKTLNLEEEYVNSLITYFKTHQNMFS